MDLNKLKSGKEKLEKLIESLSFEEDGYWLLRRLNTVKYELNNKIELEEEILNQGEQITLPSWTTYGEYEIVNHNGIQYALTKYFKDEDKSFNLGSYAFIPHKNGYVKFNVSFLGEDRFGDRIYTYSTYYATRNTDWGYLSKDYGKGKRYPIKFEEHVKFMIDEFNKLPEVNGSFDPFNKK